MHTAPVWTEDRLEQLRDFIADGWTHAEIAVEMGMTVNQVSGACDRHRILSRDVPVEISDEQIKESLVEQDYAFKRAMLRARKIGTEKVVVGVVKNGDEPHDVRHIGRTESAGIYSSPQGW